MEIFPAEFSRLGKYLLCSDLYNEWHPFQNVRVSFRPEKTFACFLNVIVQLIGKKEICFSETPLRNDFSK